MKWLILLLLVMAGAIVFTLFALEDPGFVVIGHGEWTVEMSLTVAVSLILLIWLLLNGIVLSLRGLWRLPHAVRERYEIHQQHKADESLLTSLLALLQSQWRRAERILIKTAEHSALPALHYFGASYAAHQLRESARAVDYLDKAQATLPKNSPALSLFQARLSWQQQNLPAALTNVLNARQLAPQDRDSLLLLVALYLQLADWTALLTLLPEVRKRKIFTHSQMQLLEQRAQAALMQYALRSVPALPGKTAEATTLWNNLPKSLRLKPALVKVYVQHLLMTGNMLLAESLLRETLKYHWDSDLVNLYGDVTMADTVEQLRQAESWLPVHRDDAILLLVLGRLCLRNQLWDKARHYLEAARQVPHPVTHKVIEELLLQMQPPQLLPPTSE